MAKISGYQGRLDISPDGEVSWYTLAGITSLTITKEPQTEDVTTFDDNGTTNEEPVGETVTVSVEGYKEDEDPARKFLSQLATQRQAISFRAYGDKRDLTKYSFGRAWITSYEEAQEVGGKTTYSSELGSRGSVKVSGDAF